ncbi:MAG: lysophospholipid acyltransferase family protein [Endomicrobiales bacterium]
MIKKEEKREMPEAPVRSSWLYYAGRSLFRVLFGTLWRARTSGRGNIPCQGGVIIAPNHRSVADPPLVGSMMERPLHFMAKQELFEVPALGFLIKRTNAFPVRRGRQDIGAFRMARRLLGKGEAVLMFPEGTRSRDGNFGRARAGVGMAACIAQVPVVPVRIFNSDRLGRFPALRVVYGAPVYPPKEYTKESYQKLSEQVLERIKELK